MKICIYGCQGHIGTVLDCLGGGSAHVAAVCCEPAENIEWLKSELTRLNQNFRVYSDYREMITKEKPDIAVVSSLPDKNSRAVGFTLGRDVHIFCEKPAAINYEEYLKIENAYKASKSKFYTMMTERFTPSFHTAYMAADIGLAGTVRLIDARKSYKLGERPDYYKSRKTYAGTLSWVGIHAIDRIYRASGKKFKTVFARSSDLFNGNNGEMETAAVCSCEMTDGVLASFTCDYYRPSAAKTHGDDRLRIVGTDGIIEVADNQVYYINGNRAEILPLISPPKLFDEFLNYIKNGKSSLLSSEDCLYTTYAALKITESSDKRETINL